MGNQNKLQVADRGGVFEFIEKDGSVKNMVLVVSNDHRKTDKRVSTTMLGDNDYGNDVIELDVNGKTKYIHCGMISYSMRNRLGKKLIQLSEDKMKEVDRCIMGQFGLDYVLEQIKMYEKMYKDMLRARDKNSDKEDW